MGAETFVNSWFAGNSYECGNGQDSTVGIVVYWWAMLSEKTL